jgi:hypothetical protein
MIWQEWNLNDGIRYKPTEFGRKIYRERMAAIGLQRELRTDDEGYAEDQLWSFMELYGHYMHMGFDQPCATSIFLRKT